MKPQSIISLGAITGQADNVMLSAMQSVPVHPNNDFYPCWVNLPNQLAAGKGRLVGVDRIQ